MAGDDEFFERAPLAEREETRTRTWLLRGAAAVVAVLILAVLTQLLPSAKWWDRGGFAAEAGRFVGKHPVDYRVCAPWNGWQPAQKLARGWQMTALAARPLPPTEQTANFKIVLPKTAHITTLYCGFAAQAEAARECSTDGCDAPVIVQLDDDDYTNRRVLSLSLVGKKPAAKPGDTLQVWVLWSTQP